MFLLTARADFVRAREASEPPLPGASRHPWCAPPLSAGHELGHGIRTSCKHAASRHADTRALFTSVTPSFARCSSPTPSPCSPWFSPKRPPTRKRTSSTPCSASSMVPAPRLSPPQACCGSSLEKAHGVSIETARVLLEGVVTWVGRSGAPLVAEGFSGNHIWRGPRVPVAARRPCPAGTWGLVYRTYPCEDRTFRMRGGTPPPPLRTCTKKKEGISALASRLGLRPPRSVPRQACQRALHLPTATGTIIS